MPESPFDKLHGKCPETNSMPELFVNINHPFAHFSVHYGCFSMLFSICVQEGRRLPAQGKHVMRFVVAEIASERPFQAETLSSSVKFFLLGV